MSEFVSELKAAWMGNRRRRLYQSTRGFMTPKKRLALEDEFDRQLAKHEAEVAAKAVEAFAETLEVNVGYEDDEWWRGFRQGQRRALDGAVEFAAEYRNGGG